MLDGQSGDFSQASSGCISDEDENNNRLVGNKKNFFQGFLTKVDQAYILPRQEEMVKSRHWSSINLHIYFLF